MQGRRIYIELINAPFLKMRGSGEEFRAGIALALERGWIELHGSGTFVRLVNVPFFNMGGSGEDFAQASRSPKTAAGSSCTSQGRICG
ncbi:hypothetical protein GCM10010987_73710 [Bradyrhizobium guangdongense]|uniref:Uncharacterized protein n=1 Tax=Bradyrhizobium guangdongense TaxID=1325090 RepID=A0AA87WG70_9BRAD|nr:hypothetical protein GCM10010987_73710 [Bradyrhizobium guangdongense]